VFSARRDTRAKAPIVLGDIGTRVPELLAEIQAGLLAKALAFRESHTTDVTTWEEFTQAMEGRPGFVVAHWCGSAECEATIKAETQATLRNIPFGGDASEGTCVKCGRTATVEAWFAKAY
jgi:prolyl-tRNA synthetase